MITKEFYCPLYKNNILKYDCDEISTCADTGYLFNDGLPHLLEKDYILKHKDTCLHCTQRVKKKLTVREAEYVMFIDD